MKIHAEQELEILICFLRQAEIEEGSYLRDHSIRFYAAAGPGDLGQDFKARNEIILGLPQAILPAGCLFLERAGNQHVTALYSLSRPGISDDGLRAMIYFQKECPGANLALPSNDRKDSSRELHSGESLNRAPSAGSEFGEVVYLVHAPNKTVVQDSDRKEAWTIQHRNRLW